MATAMTVEDLVTVFAGLSPEIVHLPVGRLWVDYDRAADVLYISFRKPQKATKTIEISDDVLVRKDGSKIVGITIMNVSAGKKIATCIR